MAGRDEGTQAAAAREADVGEGLDGERARLIGSIYEVVLRPEHFDSFMADWSEFVDQAARRLGELKVSEGQASRLLEDPVIEAHFRRAFALFERMGRGEAVVPLGAGVQAPLVRLGRGGAVLGAAPEAAALFGLAGAAPDLAGIRAALEPASAQRLAAFLAAFDRAPASGRFAVLSLAEAPDPATGGLAGASLPGGGLLSVMTSRDAEGEGFVAELRPMGIGWTPGLAAVLVETFRLTPRETELVRELTCGGDLPAIAERSGRSLNTLRAQLKSVFAKTRTGAQAELMRLVAALMLNGPAKASPHDPVPEPGEARLVDLGDGRVMPVLLHGPEEGVPVVFVHGMLEGLGSLPRLVPALAAAGVRLIVPMRPNFGHSYADPRVREAADLFGRDLAAVLAALGLERVVTLGHMAGSLYAHAAAARLGVRVAGVAAVAGTVPIRSIEQFATMTPRQRAIAYTARFAPALLPAVLRAGIAQIDSSSAEAFMAPLYPEGSRDRQVVEDLGIGRDIIEGYRFTVAQGLKAFQVDAWHVTRDWSAFVDGADCPIQLFHGTLDPVVSIKSVRDFAARVPRVRLQEVEGEGQLVLYARSEALMAGVGAFARACLSRN